MTIEFFCWHFLSNSSIERFDCALAACWAVESQPTGVIRIVRVAQAACAVLPFFLLLYVIFPPKLFSRSNYVFQVSACDRWCNLITDFCVDHNRLRWKGPCHSTVSYFLRLRFSIVSIRGGWSSISLFRIHPLPGCCFAPFLTACTRATLTFRGYLPTDDVAPNTGRSSK